MSTFSTPVSTSNFDPAVSRLSSSTISIPAAAPYVEAGATAVDDIDGDISSQITIVGEVNTTAVGTQRLTYQVADRAGNTSSAVRTIRVGVIGAPLFASSGSVTCVGSRRNRNHA